VLMDIGSQPDKFVATQASSDGRGSVYCLVGNRSSVPLSGILVQSRMVDDAGAVRDDRKTYSATLEGGKQDSMRFWSATIAAEELANRVECRVLAARVAD